MRGLLLTQDFPPHLSGGIAVYYHQLSKRLQGDLSVLAPRVGDSSDFDAAQPFRIHRYPMPIVPPEHMRSTRLPFLRWPRLAYVAASQWRGFLKGGAEIAGSEATEFFFFGHLYLAPLGSRLRRRTGAGYGVFLHGSELHRYMGLPPVRVAMLRALDSADFLVVNSEFTRRQYLNRGVRSDQRFVKINPGVDTSRFHAEAGDPGAVRRSFGIGGRPVILTVARLVEWKGQDTVLRALPRIVRAVPDAVYLIAGDGPFRTDLERMARVLGLADRVMFAGYIPEDELPGYYRAADVMAMPSREFRENMPMEGFGIAYVEAGACGTPVVGGQAGGTEESIEDGSTGFRVDADDPEAVADAVVRLLTDPNLARSFGVAGRRRAVEQYDWAVQARRLRDFVDGLGSERSVKTAMGGR